jgi:hypothetical protein
MRLRLSLVVISSLAIVTAAAPAPADDSGEILRRDDWSFAISPYVWAASLDGTVGVGDLPSLDIDASFGDILRNLDLAAMTVVELRYQRFGLYADIVFTNISVDGDPPREILFDGANVENELFIGTFGGAYSALDNERGHLDLLAGARAWSVDTRLNLDGGFLDDREFESNENWVDPVIGVKGRFNLGHGLYVNGLAHVGGFGVASDLTWDVFGGLSYQFNETVSAIAGYRHLEVDYDNRGFSFDVELSGPVIGAAIRF